MRKLNVNKVMQGIEQQVEKYNLLSQQGKKIEAEKKKLSTSIKEYVMENGVKDDKGSYYGECDGFVYGSVVKKSVTLIDQGRAVRFLKNNGLSDCVKVVERVDETALEKAYHEQRIEKKDFQSLFDEKVTYSVMVKEKKEMDEVEVSSLAASRK